ncbi:Aste57867_9105 [Aphanomyces stellatus]|uniref:Aste57867_9105 protein n=1 Tax=Aphanomyces stellatus TaxID=120398 RepID=A0A485KMD5_9STRA|nr:hypothetical protein As57867_009069 [Aphanomyces stellatus]VFT85989.1 Aste57867_9105 [Aphanomyces stellatus]
MTCQRTCNTPNRIGSSRSFYLNDVTEGGETVFPMSPERPVETIDHDGMDECSDELIVSPQKLHALLFYSMDGDNQLDTMSLHGDGVNLFTWNFDADEWSDAVD